MRSILKNNSETDKKLLVKISICNDKMEVIEEQECEMIIIQVYDEQGKKEEVGGDYCVMIEK